MFEGPTRSNNPRVASLTYQLRAKDPLLDFTLTAFPKDADVGTFNCRVDGETMIALPQEHFDSPDDAIAAIEPELRAWETYAEIVTGVRFGFSFAEAKIVDLDAPPETLERSGHSRVRLTLEGSYNINHSPEDFPDPPPFRLVETEAIRRLKRVLRGERDGGYPLLGAAYDIYTDLVIRYGDGDPKEAARHLNVSCKVLTQLSKLCSSNDPVHRRALKKEGSRVGPLTDDQVRWIRQLLPEIVERAARIEANAPSGPKLTRASS